LFFSDFILFVEGETELEVFGNMNLCNHFKHLRDIDVYKSSSNVIGERVNPSYSNSAIPYLFLFDADKAISISGTPNNFNLKLRKNGNYFNFKQDTLNAEYHKFKLGFSQKYKREKENIRYILDNREKNLGIDLTSQTFVNKHEFESIFKAVKHRLLSKKIYINRTTFEGCLIHEASSKIFYDWIKKEYEVDLSQILQRVRNSKRLKESMLIDYLRIIFNGKSQVFTDYSYFNVNGYEQALKKKKKINGKLSHTSRHAKMLMKILEKHIIENNSLGKTNGWATSFLNFAIHDLENKSLVLEKPFGTLFSIHFPEFYDIIQMLRPDSRGKV
ncbi:MAG: retron Eco8 family effector endonuclease, partial [Psychrobium sp.]